MGEKNYYTEGVSISVPDQSPGQSKAGGKGYERCLCWCVQCYLVRDAAPAYQDHRRML